MEALEIWLIHGASKKARTAREVQAFQGVADGGKAILPGKQYDKKCLTNDIIDGKIFEIDV